MNLFVKYRCLKCHTDLTDLTDFDGCSCNCYRSFVVLYAFLCLSKLSRSPASISTQNHFMLLFHLQPSHRFNGCSCNCCRSFVALYVVLRLSKLSLSPASIATQNHFMLLFHLQPSHRFFCSFVPSSGIPPFPLVSQRDSQRR